MTQGPDALVCIFPQPTTLQILTPYTPVSTGKQGRAHDKRADAHDCMRSLEKFVQECEPKSKLLKVYKCPIPGLVQAVIKGLLHSYQRVWHHQVAEFYERKLDMSTRSSHLILAYHWSHAADHSQADAVHVQKAAQYLHMSARAAIHECAFREGIEQLHHACRILDRVPIVKSTAQCKLELLAEIAPHTLLLYGHGSPEAMAAYNGLMMLVSEDAALDDRAAMVLSGICVNLYGKQQYETGVTIAQRIYKSGLENCNDFQVEVALSCMVQAMAFAGEFEDLFLCLERLEVAYERYKSAGKVQPFVNGVAHCVVAMACWPAALLIVGEAEKARLKLSQVFVATDCNTMQHTATYC